MTHHKFWGLNRNNNKVSVGVLKDTLHLNLKLSGKLDQPENKYSFSVTLCKTFVHAHMHEKC